MTARNRLVLGFVALSMIGFLWPTFSAASNSVATKLYNDPVYAACRNQHLAETQNENDTSPKDLSAEFTCVYEVQDYRAAEIIGEALLLSRTPVNQGTIYQIANAFYLSGSNSKALLYSKIAYSRLDNADRAKCNGNANSCKDLRTLLAKLDSSYLKQFAAEDAKARTQADAAVRKARAAEAAREASATVSDTNGGGPIGSLKGVITWQYNDFVGTKGDVGAVVALLPEFMSHKIGVEENNLTTEIGDGIDDGTLGSRGIYIGKADGYGNVEIDDVKPGRYFALIISNKTTRDASTPPDALELSMLADDFASKAALQNLADPWLTLHKSDIEMVQIRAGETAHISHDFGNTYL
jgi:hypothetical protein